METLIGISQEHLHEVTALMNGILADEAVLYFKTRNAHWNVEGPDFHSKHLFFESQYEQLDEIMDSVAERIRSLGHFAPATLHSLVQLTHLSEQSREKNDSTGFITELLRDHQSLIIRLRELISIFAEQYKDLGTSDYVTGLMETHEKMAWMLRAHLH